MSTTPQQQQPQLPNVAQITCTECQQIIQVHIPRPQLLNLINISLVIFTHERVDKCPNCGAAYAFSVPNITETATLTLQWVKLPQAPSIVAPTSGNMASALAAADLGGKLKQ